MSDPRPQASVTQRLMTGAGWVMSAQLIINIISFASSIVLARLLMPEDFGLVALALGVSALVTAFTALPLSEALIRIDHVEEDHFHSAFTLGLIRASLLTLILAAAAWPAALIYKDERLIPIMLVLAGQALLGGFYSARWPMIQKALSFRPDAVVGITMRLVAAISSVLIAYYYRNYWAIVIPVVLMQVLSVAFTHAYAPYRPRLSLAKVREIWSFSIWMTFSSVLTTFNARLDSLLIGGVLGQRAVGFYSYADEKARMPTRELSSPLVRILFPGLAAVKHDPARLAAAYKRTQAMVFAICAPFGAGFALVSDMFVHILLGDKWLPIIPIMQVLAFTLAFENLTIAAAPLAMAIGLTRTLFVRDVLAFVTRVPLIIGGLWLAGIDGVLAARVIAMICFLGLYLSLASSIAGISIADQLKGSGRTFGAVMVMSAGVILFKMSLPPDTIGHWDMLLATVALGGALYVFGHLALWAAAGRPDGPEAELLRLAAAVARKVRPQKSRQPQR